MSDLDRPADWDLPVALPELAALRRILVPFDGSHTAEQALAWAELLAAATGAGILVLVAYEPPLTRRGRGAAYVDTLRAELRDEAHELAQEAAALLSARGRDARALVVRGEVAGAILQVVEDEDVDLVVVGRRGLGSELPGVAGTVERLRAGVSGGVADRIVRHADVAVLVVDGT